VSQVDSQANITCKRILTRLKIFGLTTLFVQMDWQKFSRDERSAYIDKSLRNSVHLNLSYLTKLQGFLHHHRNVSLLRFLVMNIQFPTHVYMGWVGWVYNAR
jgi:hypothetical protein